MFRATFVTCSRTHQGMDTYGPVTNGLENWVSPKKSHQRSQSTGCVPVRKAPTNPHSQASANGVCLGEEKASSQKPAQQVKVDGDGASNTRQGVNVQFTWSGCEVKQVGNLSLFAIPRPSGSHTRSHGYCHRRRQRISSVVVIQFREVCQTKPLL